MKTGASERDIRTIDQNPHTYTLSDLSHIDWYDTPRLRAQLTESLLPNIPVETLDLSLTTIGAQDHPGSR
jgi:hypothetical protein